MKKYNLKHWLLSLATTIWVNNSFHLARILLGTVKIKEDKKSEAYFYAFFILEKAQ